MDVRGIYVDKMDSNFYENNYPEVPRWVRQQRILRILLVTGLVTQIWLTIWLVKRWAFDVYPTFKVFIYTMQYLIQLKTKNSDFTMVSHDYS